MYIQGLTIRTSAGRLAVRRTPMAIKLPGMKQEGDVAKDIQNFNSIHREVIRRHFRGDPFTVISEELSITPRWAKEIVASAQGQEMLEVLSSNADIDTIDIEQEKQRGAAESVGLLRQMVTGTDTASSLKLKAAQTLMASAGHGPIQKMVGQMHNTHEGRLAFEEFKRRSDEVDKIIEARAVPLEHYTPPTPAPAELSTSKVDPTFGPRKEPTDATREETNT
jgi:hypothetical protein